MFIKNDLAICDVVADIEEGKYDDKLQQMKAEFDTVFVAVKSSSLMRSRLVTASR